MYLMMTSSTKRSCSILLVVQRYQQEKAEHSLCSLVQLYKISDTFVAQLSTDNAKGCIE